jgi:hypothetical protein
VALVIGTVVGAVVASFRVVRIAVGSLFFGTLDRAIRRRWGLEEGAG